MRTTRLTRLLGTGLAPALAAPGAALAKTVCIHSAANAGWTFVLRDRSLRPGSSGADCTWTKMPSAGITTAWGNAAIVDCRTVPPIPRAFP